MPPPKIKRRTFLGYLFISAALIRCKKDPIAVQKPSPDPISVINPPPIGPTADYMGQYSITEIGSKLVVPDPTFNKSINGYTDQVSYNVGDTVTVYLSGPANNDAVIPLLDTRRNSILSVSTPIVTQTIKSDKPWVDGFMYDKTFSFKIPEYFKSGVYTWNKTIPFIIKGNKPTYDLTVVYPTNTANAYNFAGGKSVYAPDFNNRATVLSFLRSNAIMPAAFFQWIDNQTYNINYVADCDLDDYSQIENSKVVVITGHSEYWTRQARENIDKFVDSGKNVLMLSGNLMWWQVRYNKEKNLMVCYKDVNGYSNYDDTIDPLGTTKYSTVNWGTPVVDYPILPSIGTDYRYGGYGNMLPNRWNGFKIVQEDSPILKGTGLKNGDILNMPTTEYEGTPVVELFPPGSSQIPVIDNSVLNFHQVELLGFDFASNSQRRDKLGFGTFMVCQKSSTSGTIVHGASMDWCTNILLANGKIKAITKNMIDLSLSNSSLFTLK
jgi:hypothetical protein